MAIFSAIKIRCETRETNGKKVPLPDAIIDEKL